MQISPSKTSWNASSKSGMQTQSCKNLDNGAEKLVHVYLTDMKRLVSKWAIDMYHFLANPNLWFKAAVIVDALK